MEDELPDDFLAIHFKRTDDEGTRILEFEPHGAHFTKLVEDVVA